MAQVNSVHEQARSVLLQDADRHDTEPDNCQSIAHPLSNPTTIGEHQQNAPNTGINATMSRLSLDSTTPADDHHVNSHACRPSASVHSTWKAQRSETEAELTAFTPPLMSIRLPYRDNRTGSSTQTQEFSPFATKSQPKYYVDTFQSNFSDRPAASDDTKAKAKHVTFQEQNAISEPKINSNPTVFPSPPSACFHRPVSPHPSRFPTYYPRYSYPAPHRYPYYNPYHNVQYPAYVSDPWAGYTMPSYFPPMPYQYYSPHEQPYPQQPKQLYDPKKPKVSPPIAPHDASQVIRSIIPKNKKKPKETNTPESSIVFTDESAPQPHPITILRKPSVDRELASPSTSSVADPVLSLIEAKPTIAQDDQTSVCLDLPVAPTPAANPIAGLTLLLPTYELLAILQSANCISAFNEYAQKKKFTFTHEFTSVPPSSFTCLVSIDGQPFPASSPCSSKNEAQKLAYDQTLRTLYGQSCQREQSSAQLSTKHDYIAHRSISTFQDLNVSNALLGRKTLASMVMVINDAFEQAQVISLATGSTCLDETSLADFDHGSALHDCHAEILARRGLIRFFAEQIKHAHQRQSSIFAYNSTTRKYHLREKRTFHLYISALPCGDASLQQPSNALRYKQGQAEGTQLASTQSCIYPIKSCSDKICRWNVLGLQGALLTPLLDRPIYLETITLACEATFDRQHVPYTLCERLKDHVDSLPLPFVFNSPEIDCPQVKSFQREREVGKLQKSAFAWNITQSDKPEFLEPRTGRVKHDRSISLLSKQRLFEDMKNFIREDDPNQTLNYKQAKRLDATYVTVKNLLASAFQSGSAEANIPWLSKSDQLDDFRAEK